MGWGIAGLFGGRRQGLGGLQGFSAGGGKGLGGLQGFSALSKSLAPCCAIFYQLLSAQGPQDPRNLTGLFKSGVKCDILIFVYADFGDGYFMRNYQD